MLLGLALGTGATGGIEPIDENLASADAAARKRHVLALASARLKRISSSSSISVAGNNAR